MHAVWYLHSMSAERPVGSSAADRACIEHSGASAPPGLPRALKEAERPARRPAPLRVTLAFLVGCAGLLGASLGVAAMRDRRAPPPAATSSGLATAVDRSRAPVAEAGAPSSGSLPNSAWAPADDSELQQRLGAEPVVGARKGTGGRTLAFKLTLASGIKGYFKPEQRVSSAHWYAEVAAYHLDRALGLGRVPVVVSRRVPWSALSAAAGSDARVAEVRLAKDGSVRGALIGWLAGPLVPAVTPAGWENWVRAEPFGRTTVSPYQRAAAYGTALTAAYQRLLRREPPRSFYVTAPQPTRSELPAELSDMIIFDFLTLNYDRFGGDNANILTLGEGGPLVFLDNGDGFSAGPPRRQLLDERLAPLSRFRKRTIEALRAFDIGRYAASLAREPLAPILDRQALAGLAARREIVLEHVAAQHKRYGDVVFAW